MGKRLGVYPPQTTGTQFSLLDRENEVWINVYKFPLLDRENEVRINVYIFTILSARSRE